jgi:hypothetical protein
MESLYEERFDILAWHLKQVKGFQDYSVDEIVGGLTRAKRHKGSVTKSGLRNWRIFVMKYQYRLSFGIIGSVHGITRQRTRQIVLAELNILKNELSKQG